MDPVLTDAGGRAASQRELFPHGEAEAATTAAVMGPPPPRKPRQRAPAAAAATESEAGPDHQIHLGAGPDQGTENLSYGQVPFLYAPFLPSVQALRETVHQPLAPPWPQTLADWVKRVRVVPRPRKKKSEEAGGEAEAEGEPAAAVSGKDYSVAEFSVLLDGRRLMLGFNFLGVAVIPESKGPFRRFILHPEYSHQTPEPFASFLHRGTTGALKQLRLLREAVMLKLRPYLVKLAVPQALVPQTSFLSETSGYAPSVIVSAFVSPGKATRGARNTDLPCFEVPTNAVQAYDRAVAPYPLKRVQEGDLLAPTTSVSVSVVWGPRHPEPQVNFDLRVVSAVVVTQADKRPERDAAAFVQLVETALAQARLPQPVMDLITGIDPDSGYALPTPAEGEPLEELRKLCDAEWQKERAAAAAATAAAVQSLSVDPAAPPAAAAAAAVPEKRKRHKPAVRSKRQREADAAVRPPTPMHPSSVVEVDALGEYHMSSMVDDYADQPLS